MKLFKNLKFFNKYGNPYNFNYNEDNDSWTGNIFFNKISVNLIENETIHILEEVYDNITSELSLIKLNNYNINKQFIDEFGNIVNITDTTNNIKCNITSPNKSFKFYEIDSDYIINFDDNYHIESDIIDCNIINGDINYHKQVDVINSFKNINPINISFQPINDETIKSNFKLTTNINNQEYVILDVILYGEGIEEDERTKTLLNNIGYDLLPDDVKIFREYDINNDTLDYDFLNTKRKEFLLEHHNILPYIGSYKALANILKFYGYSNIRMKEYWINVDKNSSDLGKLKSLDIIDLFNDNNKNYINVNKSSRIYKKTNDITLHYNITIESGDYDEEGNPIVVNAFEFSLDEILIKLYALKKKLQEYYLPLGTRIIDIIGEAVYYGYMDVNFITSVNKISNISIGNITPDFSIISDDFYIKQLTGNEIGCELLIKNNLSYDGTNDAKLIFNIFNDDFNYIKEFYLSENINDFIVTIPIVGKYDIITIATDSYNSSIYRINKNAIEIKSYNIDFIGWYQALDCDYLINTKNLFKRQSLDDIKKYTNVTWDSYNSIWDYPMYPNDDISLAQIKYDSFIKNKYHNINEGDKFNFEFNQIKDISNWNNLYHLSWDNCGGYNKIQWKLSDLLINGNIDYIEIFENNTDNYSKIDLNLNIFDRSSYHNLINKLRYIDLFDKFVYKFIINDINDYDIIAYSNENISKNKYKINGISNNNIKSTINFKHIYNEVNTYFEIYDIEPNHKIELKIHKNDNLIYEYINNNGFDDINDFYNNIIQNTNNEFDYLLNNYNISKIEFSDNTIVSIKFEYKFDNNFNYKLNSFNVYNSDFICFINTNASYSDIRILRYADELPILTEVFFTYDNLYNDKNPLLNNPEWIISRDDDILFDDIYYKGENFSYVFDKRGYYNITLKLNDINNNKQVVTKKQFIKII